MSQVLRGVDVVPSNFLLAFIFDSIILLIFGLCILEIFDELFKFSMTINIFRDGHMPVPGRPLECRARLVKYSCACLKVIKYQLRFPVSLLHQVLVQQGLRMLDDP